MSVEIAGLPSKEASDSLHERQDQRPSCQDCLANVMLDSSTNFNRIAIANLPQNFLFRLDDYERPTRAVSPQPKTMMVFLTLVALFSFVVLPSVAMYQQQRLAANAGPTSLATFNGGEYDAAQVQYFTRNHFATLQVLQALAEATIASGGAPMC